MNILNIFRRQPATPEPPELIYTKLAAALNAEYSGLIFRAERHESRNRVVFTIDDPVAGLLSFDTLRSVAGWYGVSRIVCEVPDPEDSFDAAWGKDRVFYFEGQIDVVDFERATRHCYIEQFGN